MSFVLMVTMILSCVPSSAYAKENNDEARYKDLAFIAGYKVDQAGTVKRLVREEGKFANPQGHGFAAEEANNLIDRLQGKKAYVVGDDNVKNGADRKIINRDGSMILIQDKYYSTAKGSVEACFENGEFRYVCSDSSGAKKAMQIEVPKDQYEEAVKVMEEKIRAGELKNCGVTDTNEAKNIVRKGKVTCEQAKNITKAGNIDSLKYDAANGVITASCALGISFVIDFAICKMNGDSNDDALHNAAVDSLKTGGIVFASSVIASQLSKEGVCEALEISMDSLTRTLGKDFAEGLAKACGKNVTGKAAMEYTSKVLRSNLIMTAVTFGILEIRDVSDIIQGRISKQQLLKNLSVTLATLIGGEVGALAGGAIGAGTTFGAGTALGALLGSLIGAGVSGFVTAGIVSHFIKDDAEEMYAVIEEEFQNLGNDYMINQAEANGIADELKEQLDDDTLKDMFQSEDRKEFAKNILEPLFEKQVKQRAKIEVASEEETRWELRDSLKGVVYIH